MSEFFIGLQLYTIRDQTALDFAKSLRYVGEMGYDGVEFAGYGSLGSRDMAALLADNNLRAGSSHVGLHLLEADAERELNYCLDIGSSYLVIPSAPQEWRDADGLPKLVERLNFYGQLCQERGITLAYHNHDFEFQQVPGGLYLEQLLAQTDPALVKLELDTYWAASAGLNPVELLQRYSDRITLVHLKDMNEQRTFTEIGTGTLDIASYVGEAREIGVQWGFVENDQPAIPSLESARISAVNLRKLL